ncbi:unnamed protein product, partial [Rangifer tarandus platyrhynchus]
KGSTSCQEAPHRKSRTQTPRRMLTTPNTSLPFPGNAQRVVLLRCRHPARRARLQLVLGQQRTPHGQPVSRLEHSLLLKLLTCQV